MKIFTTAACLLFAAAAWADVSDPGSLTINGQAVVGGTMAVQGSAFSVGASSFVVTGSSVGIRTASPAAALDVNGSAQFGQGAAKSTFTATGGLQVPYGVTAGTLTAINATVTGAGNALVINNASGWAQFQNGTDTNYVGSGLALVTGAGSRDIAIRAGDSGGSQILFAQGPTTRAKIDTGGNFVETYGVTAGSVAATTNGDSIAGAFTSQAGATSPALKAFKNSGATSTDPVFSAFNGNAGGTEILRIQANGNVGIGTTSPASRMSVQSSAINASTQTVMRLINPGSGIGTGATLELGYGDSEVGANSAISGFYDGTGNALAFYTGPTSASVPIERARIDRNGNFGVGTASPNAKLHVSSGTLLVDGTSPTLQINSSGSQNNTIQFGVGSTQASIQQEISAGGACTLTSANDLCIRTDASPGGNIAFAPQGGATKMFLTRSGNLGVGTASPNAKLHLSSGTLTVDGTAGAINVAVGSVTASAFYGDGSHLTGVNSLSGGMANVMPVWTGSNSLGIGSGYITSVSSGVNISTDVTFSGGVNIASQTYIYVANSDPLVTTVAGCNASTVTLSSWSGSGPAAIEAHASIESYNNTGNCDMWIIMDGNFLDSYTISTPMATGTSNSGTPIIHPINMYYVTDTPISKGTHSFCMYFAPQGGGSCHVNCDPSTNTDGFGHGSKCKLKVREYP